MGRQLRVVPVRHDEIQHRVGAYVLDACPGQRNVRILGYEYGSPPVRVVVTARSGRIRVLFDSFEPPHRLEGSPAVEDQASRLYRRVIARRPHHQPRIDDFVRRAVPIDDIAARDRAFEWRDVRAVGAGFNDLGRLRALVDIDETVCGQCGQHDRKTDDRDPVTRQIERGKEGGEHDHESRMDQRFHQADVVRYAASQGNLVTELICELVFDPDSDCDERRSGQRIAQERSDFAEQGRRGAGRLDAGRGV